VVYINLQNLFTIDAVVLIISKL